MFQTISKKVDELEKWRENPNTEDTLTQIQTSLNAIKETDATIQLDEEEATIEFPSLLRVVVRGDDGKANPLQNVKRNIERKSWSEYRP